MCTNPITIYRKNLSSNSTKEYIIPCGKCAECTKKKQGEFAALSIHQALKSGILHFFTFTYKDEQLPIAISEMTPEGKPRLVGFRRDGYFWKDSKGVFKNAVVHQSGFPDLGYFTACSLCREDVKKILKQFRKDNPDAKFKYAVFGEYGEQRGRPHYHGLFYGLTAEQAKSLSDLWSKRFGFCLCLPQVNKSMSLDDIKAMSLYCSKYISKGVHSRWSHLLPYVESPRRQSSLNFGNFDEHELASLAHFMMGATSVQDFDMIGLLSWIWSCLDAHLSKLLDKVSPFLNV